MVSYTCKHIQNDDDILSLKFLSHKIQPFDSFVSMIFHNSFLFFYFDFWFRTTYESRFVTE